LNPTEVELIRLSKKESNDLQMPTRHGMDIAGVLKYSYNPKHNPALGTQAPLFIANDEWVNFDKPTILHFFNSDSAVAVKDLKVLNQSKKDYGKNLETNIYAISHKEQDWLDNLQKTHNLDEIVFLSDKYQLIAFEYNCQEKPALYSLTTYFILNGLIDFFITTASDQLRYQLPALLRIILSGKSTNAGRHS
jgi:peroxiredoxin